MSKNKITLITILLVLLAPNLFSQIPTNVTETTEIIGDVSGNSFHVRIHRASKKEILKAVKSILKERSEEVKTKGDEVYASQSLFPFISDHEIKVYAKVKEFSDTEHELYLIFLNGDQNISSQADLKDYNSAKAFLYEFANKLSRESNKSFLANSEKELSSLERNIENLRSEKTRDDDAIIKNGKKIKKNESDIKKLDDKESLDENAIKERAKKEKNILSLKRKNKNLKNRLTENKKEQDGLIEKIKEKRALIKEVKSDIETFD